MVPPEGTSKLPVCIMPEVLQGSVDERFVFWNRAASVKQDMMPPFRSSTWAAGCPCHEDALVAGVVPRSPRKGCRVTEMPDRVHQGVLELAYGRDKLRDAGAVAGIREEAASLLFANFIGPASCYTACGMCAALRPPHTAVLQYLTAPGHPRKSVRT